MGVISIRVSLVQLFKKVFFLKKWSFQKVHNKKVFFEKAEYLVKTVKKCFLKKLKVWLALINAECLASAYEMKFSKSA